MKILIFLVSKKFRFFLNIKKNWTQIIFQFLTLLIFILTAYSLSFLYENSLTKEVNIDPKLIYEGLIYFLLSFPSIYSFFPSVATKQILIHQYYPYKKNQSTLLELGYQVFSKFWIYTMLLVCVVFCMNASHLNINDFFVFLTTGLVGILISEFLVNFYHKKKGVVFFLITVLIAVILFFFIDLGQFNIINLLLILSILIFFLLNVGYSKNFEPTKEGNKIIFKDSSSYILKFTFNTHLYLNAITFSIIIQIIFAFIYFQYLYSSFASFKFYIFSSIILFTYCFNNLWGFFPKIAINHFFSGAEIKTYITIYYRLLLIPSILNTIILFSLFLFFPDILSLNLIFSFFSLTFFSSSMGLFFSFFKTKKISTAVSFDSNNFNSSKIPMYIFGVVSLIIGFFESNLLLFYISNFIIFLISIGILIYLIYKGNYFTDKLVKILLINNQQ
jgi:hypothetical protein